MIGRTALRTSFHNVYTLTALIASLHVLGCSADLPSAPPVALPFTMFGVVNPTADTQAVVVYSVESGALEPVGPEPLDALVRSTDVQSGEVRVWRDSVVSIRDESYSHVFRSDFRAKFGHSYHLEVVRSDGSKSTATINVPQMVKMQESDDGTSRMRVAFRGGPFRLVQLQITFGVRVASRECTAARLPFHYVFPYAGEEVRQEDGWALIVDLQRYVPIMEEFVREDTGCYFLFADSRTRLALIGLTLNVTVGDEAWDLPHGILDRRVLSHPGTLTNVENGLGFVGGGYMDEKELFPSGDAIEGAGFHDCLEGRAGCETATAAAHTLRRRPGRGGE